MRVFGPLSVLPTAVQAESHLCIPLAYNVSCFLSEAELETKGLSFP